MLEAAVLGGRTAGGGLLLGHKRGGRFIIEKAVPCGPGVFPGRNVYPRLAIQFGGFLFFFAAEKARTPAALQRGQGFPGGQSGTARLIPEGVPGRLHKPFPVEAAQDRFSSQSRSPCLKS